METKGNVDQGSEVKRPLGVWLLTIYAAFSAGILPIVTLIALGRSEFAFSALSVVITGLLAIAVIVTAVGTWRGSNRARKLLLILITVHYALIAFNNAWLLLSGAELVGERPRMVGRILRGFLYPAIYIWYFSRTETMAFFLSADEAEVRSRIDRGRRSNVLGRIDE